MFCLITSGVLTSGAGELPGDFVHVEPPKIAVKGDTLYYEGQIDDASVDEVERALTAASAAGHPVLSLVIDSPGGSDAGIRFGEIVLARKLAVRVRNTCASACANWVALSARELAVPDGTVLAFHGGAVKITPESEKFWTKTLKERGASDDMAKATVDRMRAMQARELALFEAIGVSHKILEDSQTRHGQSRSRLWMFTREVLENCYNVKNIKQYPVIPADQTIIDGWAEVVRECPSANK